MGAVAAEAPLRLPAAPPLAFCCYTSVLLLFAFSLPGSRASNQPPGGGGGGDCPGGKGKSINCSGRTGRSAPLRPLLPSAPAPPPARSPRRGPARPGRGGPGSQAEGERGRRAGRERAMRAWGPAWGRGVAVRASVCAKWLGAGGRACGDGMRPGRQVGGSRLGLRCGRGCARGSACLCCEGSGEGGGRPQAGLFCVLV